MTSRNRNRTTAFLAAAAALAGTSVSSAATLYWDGSDVTANADGGAGTWDTASSSWDNAASSGSNATWSNANPDSAVFGGTAGTVTLGTAITAGTLTFNTASYKLDTAANNLTASALAGSGNFTKYGTGSLLLSASSSYTGAITVSGGTLRLNSSASLSSGTGITINGGAAATAGSYPLNYTGIRSGMLVLNRTGDNLGSQTVTLNNAGLIYISPAGGSDTGTVQNLTAASGINELMAAPSGGVTGDTLAITNLTVSTGASVLFRSNYGTLGNSGDNGRITVANLNGSALANTNGILGGWAYAVSGTGVAVGFAAKAASTNDVIQATPDMSNSGSGASANNNDLASGTSTQNWIINSGSSFNTIGASGATTVTINSLIEEADVKINNGSTLVIASGGVIFRSNNFWMQTSAGNTGYLTSGRTDGRLFIYADGGGASSDQYIKVIIKDNGGTAVSLVKNGVGLLKLSQYSTYTGGTVVNQGVLRSDIAGNFGSGGMSFGTGSITINGGGTLRAGSYHQFGWNANTWNNIIINDGGTFDLQSGNDNYIGTLTLADNATIAGSSSNYVGLSRGTLTYSGSFSGKQATIATKLYLGSPQSAVNATFTIDGSNASGDLVANGAITGTSSLTKAGNGMLVMSGANTYSGGTVLNAGTVKLNVGESAGTSGPLGSGGTITLGGGTLQYSASNSYDYSGRFSTAASQQYKVDTNSQNVTWATGLTSSGGTLAKVGAGTLTLTGVSSFSGAITLSAGTLEVGGSGQLGSGSYAANISDAGTLKFSTSSNQTLSGIVSGAGSLVKSGNGILTLSNANTYTGTTSVDGGTLVVASTGSLASGSAVSVANTAALSITSGGSVAGTVSVATGGTLTVSGALSGALTLAGSASVSGTASGGTTVNSGGVLTVNSGGAVSGVSTVNSGGTLTVSSGGNAGAVTVNSGGLLKGSGTVGAVTVASGTGALTAGNGLSGVLSLSSLSFSGNGVLNIGSLSNYTSSAALSITGALTLGGGAGSVTLAMPVAAVSNGTYNLISFGSTNATTAKFTFTGPLISSRQGGALNLTGTALQYVVSGDSPVWTGANSSAFYGGNNWKLITAGTVTDFLANDSLLLDDTATTTTVDISGGDVAPVGMAFSNSSKNYVLQGSSSVTSGSLVKSGTGSLTISNANNFATVTLNAGTIVLNNASALGTTATTLAGGTLDLNGQSSAAPVALAGGALAGAGTLTGAVTGTSGLTKTGNGALTLTNSGNTFTGGIAIQAGSVAVAGAAGTVASQALTLGSGTSSGVLVLGDGSNAKSLTFTSLNTSGTGTGNAVVGGGSGSYSTLTVDTSSNNTFAGAIGGVGANQNFVNLTKSGTGTLTLTGDSTYTGVTTLSAGVLQVGSAAALGASSATLALNGGTLSSDSTAARALTATGASTIGGNVTLGDAINNGAITLANAFDLGGATRTLTAASNATLSGALSNGGLTKAGAGTLTLSGASTYSGNTTVSNGTLKISGGIYRGAYFGGSVVAVGSGGILELDNWHYDAANASLGGLTANVSGITINGGTIRIVGAAATSYGRGVTVNSGGATLEAGSGATWTIDTVTDNNDWIFSGNPSLTLTGAGTGTFQKVISSGTGSVTKSGSGTWTLSGANTFSGSLTANNGTLVVNNSLRSVSGVTANVGSTIKLNATNVFTSGHGSAVGASMLLTANGGTLVLDTGMESRIGSVTLSNGGTLTSNRALTSYDVLLGNLSSGVAATVTVNGNAAATMNGTGGIHLQGMQNFDVADVTSSAATDLTVSMVLGATGTSGGAAGGINKLGAGTMLLNNVANAFAGNITVSAGTLAGNGVTGGTNSVFGAFAAGRTITVSSGATLALLSTNVLGGQAQTLGNTPKVILNGGTMTAATYNVVGDIDLNGGTLTATGSSASNYQTYEFNGSTLTVGGSAASTVSSTAPSNGGMHIGGGTTLTLDVGDVAAGVDLTVSAALLNGSTDRPGAGSLLKKGTGTLRLSASNSYDGATSVNAGIVEVTSNAGLGSSVAGTTVASGAALKLSSVTYTTAEALSISGTGVSGGGALVNSGTSSFAGAITAAASSTINLGGGILSLSGGLVKDGTVLTVTGGGTLNVGTVGISGASANSDLVVDGSTVNLNAASTYNGPTYIRNGGVINATVANALPTANGRTVLVMDDSGTGASSLAITGSGQSVASLAGASTSTVSVASGLALTIGSSSGSTTFQGVISGAGGLTKDGASTLVLTGANTYTGATNVSAGTLSIGSSGSLASGSAVSVGNGATLSVASGGAVGGTMTLATGSVATVAAGGAISGATSLGSGSVATVNGTLGSVAVDSGALLKGSGTVGAVTVASGTGALTAGDGVSGSLSLASLTFSGNGVLNIGTLSNYTSSSAFGITGALTLGGGSGSVTLAMPVAAVSNGTYNLISFGSTNATIGKFAITGPLVSSRQGGVLNLTGTALQYVVTGDSPIWTGANGSAFSGGNNWKLINAGTTTDFLANDNLLLNDTAIATTVDISGGNVAPTGLTFDNSSTNYVLQGSSSVTTGSLVKSGTGSLTISNANTFSSVTLNAGTIVLANAGALGTASATLAGGTLDVNGQSSAAAIVLAGGTLTGAGTLSGNITGTGALTKLGNGTLTLSGTSSYSGGTTVSAGTLAGDTASLQGAITNNAAVTFNQGSAGTYAGAMSGTGALTKVGNGTLTLAGANSYSGGTTVSAGTLAGDTASLQGAITNNAAVTFNQGSSGTYSGLMSGTGSLTKSGVGTLTLAGANSYSGGSTLNAGALVVSADNNLGDVSGALTFGGNSILRLGASFTSARNYAINNGVTATVDTNGYNLTDSGSVSGLGSLTKSGAGTLALNGVSTFSGGITVSAGTLEVGGAGQLGSGSYAGNIANAGTLKFSSSANQTLSGAVTGVGSLTKSGNGTLSLTGTGNDYTGSTTVSGGTLSITGSAKIHASTGNNYTTTVNSGGTLEVSDFGWNGNLGQTWTNAGFSLNGGTLRVIANSASRPISLDAGSAIEVANGVTLTQAFAISGTGTLSKTGAGVLNLSTLPTYSGATTVNGGTLKISFGASSSLATPSITVNSGGTLQISAQDGLYYASGKAALTINGGTVTIDSGLRATIANTINMTGGTLAGTGTGDTWANYSMFGAGIAATSDASGNAALISAARLALQDSGGLTTFNVTRGAATPATDLNVTGNIVTMNGSTNGINKTGNGIMTVSGTNTYTGGTTVSAGTLVVASAAGLSTGSLNVNGGTLSLGTAVSGVSTATLTSGTISGAGSLTASSFDVQSGTVSAVLAGSGALSKTGSGTVTLRAASTFTGGTTISNGKLAVGIDGALRSGYAISLSSYLIGAGGATYTLTPSSITTGGTAYINGVGSDNSLVIAGTGGVTMSGSELYMSGTHTYTGTTSVGGTGYLEVSGGALNISGSVLDVTSTNSKAVDIWAGKLTVRGLTGTGIVASNGSSGNAFSGTALEFATQNGDSFTFSGTLKNATWSNGQMAIAKTGAGTQILSGNNTYSGGTAISGGILVAGSSTALGSGAVALSAGGTLDVNGQTLANAITASGGSVTGAGTLSGAITGTGSLTKSGNGTLTLSGTSNFSGGLSVTGGTLVAAGASSLGSGTVTVAGGALNLGGLAIGNAIAYNSGSITGTGALTGSLALTGTSLTFTGLTTFGSAGITVGAGATLDLNFLNPTNAITLSGGTIVHYANWTGPVSLAGTVDATLINSLTSNTVTVAAGSTVDLTGVSKDIVYTGGALSNLSGYTGTLTVRGALDLTGGAPASTGTVRVESGSVNFGNNSFAGTVQYLGGAITNYAGAVNVTGTNVSLTAANLNGASLVLAAGNTATIGAGLQADIRLEGGSVTTTSLNNLSGTVTVAANQLLDLGGSPGNFAVSNLGANIVVESGATLKGTASVGSITAQAGSILAPGNSPGQIVASSYTALGGSAYDFEIRTIVDTNTGLPSVAGFDYDTITVAGELDLTALSVSSQLLLNLITLDMFNVNSTAEGWDPATAFELTLFSYGTLKLSEGASLSDLFDINSDAFLDANFNPVFKGHFSVVNDTLNSELRLVYSTTAIPEPSTYGLMLGGLALAAAAIRRRRKSSK